MKYDFTAVIHPVTGDDRVLDGTIAISGCNESTANELKIVNREIRKLIRKNKSVVLNDYTINRFY